jgi:hypothetical protein
MNEIRCPKCSSTQITANKKGFSGKKAVAGAVLTGGIGLLAGTLGSGNIIITCLACGHEFKPGQGAVNQASIINGTQENFIEALKNGEITDFDYGLIQVIKDEGLLNAIKEVKNKKNIDLRQAKEYVDKLKAKYNVQPHETKGGCAGVVIFFIVVISTLCKFIFFQV